MDTGTVIALSFGGGAMFGFILAVISVWIDRCCSGRKAAKAKEKELLLEAPPVNNVKHLSPLLCDRTDSQISDIRTDNCSTPSISEIVLVKKTDCDVESELAEHYNSHPSPSEDRNSQVYIGEATDQKSLEKLETNKDDRTSNEDTSTLCASSVECDPEHSEMIKSEDSSVGSIFQYMNALLSDKVVENLNQSERKEILILIAHRFDMSYSKKKDLEERLLCGYDK